jgi:D-arabinose 1-dehydrogenase-like Zn-dependent alcohol dehydrogenase
MKGFSFTIECTVPQHYLHPKKTDNMPKSSLWAVVGPVDGLGSAAIRYLLARNQTVIAISCNDRTSISAPNLETAHLIVTPETVSCSCLQRLTTQYGKIDALVDNYKSLPVLRFLLSYMTPGKGRIILTPPDSAYKQELSDELHLLGASQTISTYLCS